MRIIIESTGNDLNVFAVATAVLELAEEGSSRHCMEMLLDDSHELIGLKHHRLGITIKEDADLTLDQGSRVVTSGIQVCAECLNAIANGTSGMDLSPEEESIIWEGINAWQEDGKYNLVAGDDDYGFCRTECECCNRERSAGFRYEAVLLS